MEWNGRSKVGQVDKCNACMDCEHYHHQSVNIVVSKVDTI